MSPQSLGQCRYCHTKLPMQLVGTDKLVSRIQCPNCKAGEAVCTSADLLKRGEESKRVMAEQRHDALCAFCGKPEPGWLLADLAIGRRARDGNTEFHCPGARG